MFGESRNPWWAFCMTNFVNKKQENPAAVVVGLVLLLFVVAVGALLYNWADNLYIEHEADVPGSDLTIFPILCSNRATDLQDCQNPTPIGRIAYKINANSHSVVVWFPDLVSALQNSATKYQNYDNCAIVDNKDWSCTDSNNDSFGENSGTYFNTLLNGLNVYVSAQQWEQVRGANAADAQ